MDSCAEANTIVRATTLLSRAVLKLFMALGKVVGSSRMSWLNPDRSGHWQRTDTKIRLVFPRVEAANCDSFFVIDKQRTGCFFRIRSVEFAGV